MTMVNSGLKGLMLEGLNFALNYKINHKQHMSVALLLNTRGRTRALVQLKLLKAVCLESRG